MSLVLIKDLGFKYLNSIRKDTGKQDRKSYALYRCYCGKEFEAFKSCVKSGNTKSCGCYKKKLSVSLNTTHGLSKHRLYKTWQQMMTRCYNKNAESYGLYGKKGVTVCLRWHDVANFISDMFPSFIEGLTLDRIDSSGNYEPSNCRWATDSVQAQNTKLIRKNNTSGYNGVIWNKHRNKWMATISISNKRICLGHFLDKKEAAKVRDKYIIDNNLHHPLNFILDIK